MKTSIKHISLLCMLSLSITSCGIFGGITLKEDIETFEIRKFADNSKTVKPGLSERFSLKFEEHILSHTNLTYVTDNGHVVYQGEIIRFENGPKRVGTSLSLKENRLIISVRVIFTDTKDSENNLQKVFTGHHDYDNGLALIDVEEEAFKEIFQKIYDDIVDATILRW